MTFFVGYQVRGQLTRQQNLLEEASTLTFLEN